VTLRRRRQQQQQQQQGFDKTGVAPFRVRRIATPKTLENAQSCRQ
jgi:hypothetical protein